MVYPKIASLPILFIRRSNYTCNKLTRKTRPCDCSARPETGTKADRYISACFWGLLAGDRPAKERLLLSLLPPLLNDCPMQRKRSCLHPLGPRTDLIVTLIDNLTALPEQALRLMLVRHHGHCA